MITHWVTCSTTYYQLAHIPVYVKPNEDMLLLRLDYMGLYFPRIYFFKFHLIQAILTTDLKCDSRNPCMEITPNKVVDCIDLSRDFLEKAEIQRINYSQFPTIMYHLLTGDEYHMKKYKEYYQPLVPFFQFLGLEKQYLDMMPE